MRTRVAGIFRIGVVAAVCAFSSTPSAAQNDATVWPFVKPEQRRIHHRDPACLPDVYVPATPPPPTVGQPLPEDALRMISLDEAIRIALADSEVVRTLAGNIAVSSGRTIYDPAIANNVVDQERAAFDPQLIVDNAWSQTEPATLPPSAGTKTENHNLTVDLSQRNLAGGMARLRFGNDASRTNPRIFLLDPQNNYATELSYTHPLLRGRGVCANRVPIVLARIDTERSYFQLSDSVQELVRGVIEAYWAVVFARTDVWAREIQVEQAEESFRFADARQRRGFADITEAAQAKSALANFRASLITSRSNLLQREAALQNILGIPPTALQKLVPVTSPTDERIEFPWNEIIQIAQVRRPDLIELKLILEADQQRLLLAENQTQPQLDLFGLYRWNGLEGRLPSGARMGTNGDAATDWTLGVNFSVPLYLRQERASLRSARLLVERDRAVLEQGVHSARHRLAVSFRNLDQFHLQYEAFAEARDAARENLERQYAAFRLEQPVQFINVLQAISDWGNSVSQAAQALTQYNTELANIERETGTILETHGVFFYEDRFCALGPNNLSGKPCIREPQCCPYPRDIRASENAPQYPGGEKPSEEAFDLDDYPHRRRREQVAPPAEDTEQKQDDVPPPRPQPEPIGLVNPAALR